MKKTLAISAGILLFASIAHGFSGIFGAETIPDISLVRDLNPHIIPGNTKLSSTVLIIKTKKDVQVTGFKSPCPISFKNLYKNTADQQTNVEIYELRFPS